MDWNATLEPLATVALAGLVGGLVGLERELARKPAGLRTHVLVAAAAALLMLLGPASLGAFEEAASRDLIRADPSRVIQAIVVGISFLGAGTILRNGTSHVEGLTTAASILLTTALGIAVALGKVGLAFGVAMLMVVVLLVLGRLERALEHQAAANDR